MATKLTTAFVLLFTSVISVNAQRKTAATIFEYFNIPEKRMPVEDILAKKEEFDEGIVQSMYERYPELPPNNTDVATQIPVISSYLRSTYTSGTEWHEALDFYTKEGSFYLMQKNNTYTLYNKQKKAVWTKTFVYVAREQGDNEGFNAWDKKGNHFYYSRDGQLLFDKKYQYVVNDYDGFFRVYQNNKTGIADRKGNLLLPINYKYAHAFRFNDEIYFEVSNETGNYYIFPGGKKVVFPRSFGRRALGNKYWLLSGKLYDIKKIEQLFYGITEYIEVVDPEKEIFYITTRDNQKLIFDIHGKLFTGGALTSYQSFNKKHYIAGIQTGEEKKMYGQKYFESLYGLLDKNYNWYIEPNYRMIQGFSRDSTLLYFSKTGKKTGLMDITGKVIVPDTIFNSISVIKEGYFLCNNDTGSWVFSRKQDEYKKLDSRYEWVQEMKVKNASYYRFMDKKGEGTWFDSTFTPGGPGYDITEVNSYSIAGKCIATRGVPPLKSFINEKLEEEPVSVAGEKTTRFRDIQSTHDSSVILYRLTDGRNIAQFANGRWFATPHTSLTYEADSKLFFSYKNGLYGIIDTMGRELLPPVMKSNYRFSVYGRMPIELTNGKTYVLMRDGTVLLDGKYQTVSRIVDGYFIVSNGNGYGVVNSDGKIIIPLQHTYLQMEYGQLRFGRSYSDYDSWSISQLLSKR